VDGFPFFLIARLPGGPSCSSLRVQASDCSRTGLPRGAAPVSGCFVWHASCTYKLEEACGRYFPVISLGAWCLVGFFGITSPALERKRARLPAQTGAEILGEKATGFGGQQNQFQSPLGWFILIPGIRNFSRQFRDTWTLDRIANGVSMNHEWERFIPVCNRLQPGASRH